jgi:hypothetical protein
MRDRGALAPTVVGRTLPAAPTVFAAVAAVVLTLAACSTTATSSTATSSGPGARTETSPVPSRAVAAGADHDCVVPGSSPPVVPWAALRNPVLSRLDAGVKDQAMAWAGGRWHMLFSEVTDDPRAPDGIRWSIAVATSRDLEHWSTPRPWSSQVGGEASPDLVRAPNGRFVATYDSPPGEARGQEAKLYYRTSRDLVHWSAPRPLAHSLAPNPRDRMIDAALAWTGNGLVLGFKAGTTDTTQQMEMAWSPNGSLDGPWHVLGRPDISVNGGTVENAELLTVGGHWMMMATSNNLDQPWIFRLGGDGRDPADWLRWSQGRELQVPTQSWDDAPGLSSLTFEHANSAYLCVVGGPRPYLLTYAGSDELRDFGGWGHAKIGVAWSRDLVHWHVPASRA